MMAVVAAYAEERAMPAAGLRPARWVCAASVLAAVVLRSLYLAQPWRIDWATWPMFLGDEGTHGLMARHILQGARPVFYYGAYYHGAFDAYLSAAAFALFGDSLAVLRLVPTAFSLSAIPLAYGIARRLYGRQAGALAAAMVALPSTFVFEWGSLSLCGYCGYVTLALASLYGVLLVFERATLPRLVALGLVSGISAWNNQLAFGFVAVSAAALFFWSTLERRAWTVLLVAGAVGVAPLIYGNIAYPLSTFRQLGRKAHFAWTLTKDHVVQAPVEESPGVREYFALPIFEVLGPQPRRDGQWSPLGSVGAVFFMAALLAAARDLNRKRRRDAAGFRLEAILLAFALVAFGVGIGGFTRQPVGRYQLPLYPLLAIVSAGWIAKAAPRWATIVVAVVVLTRGVGIWLPVPSDNSTPREDVIANLEQRDLRRGYAAGQMYDIVFQSAERVILVPLDHSRYLPYQAQVAAAERIFYLYRTDHEDKDAHLAFIGFLAKSGIRYQRLDVGNYHILHGFEPREAINPESIAKIRADFRGKKFGQRP